MYNTLGIIMKKEEQMAIFPSRIAKGQFFAIKWQKKWVSKLWSLDHSPTFSDVHDMWKQLVEEEFGAIANDLSALTKNQRIVLQIICRHSYVPEPHADTFMQQVNLSPRSITLAISALEKTDHIEWQKKGYRAIDPVTKYILNQ